jgi:DNA transposition AAA+ family ATPase
MSVYPVAPQNKLIQRVLAFLEQSQVRLLMVDDAHCLNHEHLETLRVLKEKSGCTVLLIGHPSLLAHMNRSFQVDSCAVDPSDARTNKEDA